MLRKLGLLATAALLVAGCGDRGLYNKSFYRPANAVMLQDVTAGGKPVVFSYTHNLELILPHGGVKQSFEKARDTCLHEAALACELVSASLSSGLSSDEASVVVALPHDRVAVFEKMLTDAGASVQSRSTNAENVTTQASDNDRKIAQLTAWRDRLAALAKRNNLSVADVMKVEAELSKVEADLGAALAEKHDIGNRIAKELVTISFGEKERALAPIGRVFVNAGATLTDSTASAIEFLIRVVPWLPIIFAGLWLVRWLWSKRKKTA
jgi:hypothetical protein